MNQTQEQREGHWLAMTPNHTYYLVPTEKMKILEKQREKYTGRRSPGDVKYYRNRDILVSHVLATGIDRGEAYELMKDAKVLTYKGLTISLGRFRTLCCTLHKKLNKPKIDLIQDKVYRLFLKGLSIDQIGARLGMKRTNIDNALARARYAVSQNNTN